MGNTRHKDAKWSIGERPDMQGAHLGLLMDLRDELKQLNALLGCRNFTDVPQILRDIRDAVRGGGYLCKCRRPFETRKGRQNHITIARRKGTGTHGVLVR